MSINFIANNANKVSSPSEYAVYIDNLVASMGLKDEQEYYDLMYNYCDEIENPGRVTDPFVRATDKSKKSACCLDDAINHELATLSISRNVEDVTRSK